MMMQGSDDWATAGGRKRQVCTWGEPTAIDKIFNNTGEVAFDPRAPTAIHQDAAIGGDAPG